MAFSIRLDPDTERAITRLARLRRQPKSAIVREALAAYGRAQQSSAVPKTAAEALAPFIGAADSGGSHRSERTGEGFRALVAGKRRARRSR